MTQIFECEELADEAIDDLRAFIHTEQQFIQEEHELHAKLLQWDYVIVHLAERIPRELEHLHNFNDQISAKLIEIRDLIESGALSDLRIEKEEEQVLQSLGQEIAHREWRAVKSESIAGFEDQKRVLRLQQDELRLLHSKFIDLMKLMKRSRLIAAVESDLTEQKQKEDYKKVEEYYLVQIYNFVRAYERIFRHLLKKEMMIARKTKRTVKKMRE